MSEEVSMKRIIQSIQSIIYLLITHQAMKQYEHQDETSRTARHQVHLRLPLIHG